jgi:hypothetical protein
MVVVLVDSVELDDAVFVGVGVGVGVVVSTAICLVLIAAEFVEFLGAVTLVACVVEL